MTHTSKNVARLRDALLLFARVGSDNPAIRRTAEAKLADLRRESEAGPSPGEGFGRRCAQILRDEAARLSAEPLDADDARVAGDATRRPVTGQ